MASEYCSRSLSPVMFQVAPPSMLLHTPCVPAYSVVGVTGSIAREKSWAWTDAGFSEVRTANAMRTQRNALTPVIACLSFYDARTRDTASPLECDWTCTNHPRGLLLRLVIGREVSVWTSNDV